MCVCGCVCKTKHKFRLDEPNRWSFCFWFLFCLVLKSKYLFCLDLITFHWKLNGIECKKNGSVFILTLISIPESEIKFVLNKCTKIHMKTVSSIKLKVSLKARHIFCMNSNQSMSH